MFIIRFIELQETPSFQLLGTLELLAYILPCNHSLGFGFVGGISITLITTVSSFDFVPGNFILTFCIRRRRKRIFLL